MDEQALIEKLDAAKGRNEQIMVLVEADWTASQIARVLETTRNAVLGVSKRRREKMKREAA